jgi:AcrR family transcriptional regulator
VVRGGGHHWVSPFAKHAVYRIDAAQDTIRLTLCQVKKTESAAGAKRPYRLKERARRQEETRRRIAAVTAELHQKVGPARTTIAEVARRAGVQRLTVYRNFPRERDLLAACQAHFLADHPAPDPTPALALADPLERVRHALIGLYAWYRDTESMTANVQRDRPLVPELDALLAESSDRQLDQLAGALAQGLAVRAEPVVATRAIVRLALDFSTWKRLTSTGLSDDDAANLMTRVAQAAAAR